MNKNASMTAVDHIGGSSGTEQVLFALDGVTFEIELSNHHAEQLRNKMSRFIRAARRVGGRKLRTAGSFSTAPEAVRASRIRNQVIRSWARSNGWDIADRGPIPAEVVRAYDSAHQ